MKTWSQWSPVNSCVATALHHLYLWLLAAGTCAHAGCVHGTSRQPGSHSSTGPNLQDVGRQLR